MSTRTREALSRKDRVGGDARELLDGGGAEKLYVVGSALFIDAVLAGLATAATYKIGGDEGNKHEQIITPFTIWLYLVIAGGLSVLRNIYVAFSGKDSYDRSWTRPIVYAAM